jgi:2-keto-4-pentenoate hydratase/2-oxohepta-3-ene-1,7-dioic acid hydratase in catechol pathway
VENQTVYCRLGHDAWYRVIRYNEKEVSLQNRALSFNDIWQQKVPTQPIEPADLIKKPWQELLVPLPDPAIECRGYALTYEKHREEVDMETLETLCRFPKAGPAQSMFLPVAYRSNLDYEAEIGMLVNRNDPSRFGYFMVNDLTDRGIQARTYDKKNPAPGFAEAKRFEGALRAGPLLMIGDASLFDEIKIRLSVNGEIRQRVNGWECMLTPEQIHQDVFSSTETGEWALIASGTSGGTIFYTPNILQKLMLFSRSGFSMDRAKERWLASFPFLAADDEIEFQSPQLGIGRAKVVNED